MRMKLFVFAGVLVGGTLASAQSSDTARWKAESARVTITRDDWGIAHVHGHTDADAVFGMIYAQCEDDFHRVERNYLTALGRTAEADGEGAIWADLRQRLFIDPEDLKRDYAQSPAWLRKLMDAWADGINFFLSTHLDVKPQVLTHFEPWMALSFTEGSIGGDIEKIDLKKLQAFYDKAPSTPGAHAELEQPNAYPDDPQGSNGIAIAPSNTLDHHALLLINPHTTFFFRSELQMSSDQGLDAYGAVTWGQFFVYQGFNNRAGWMHTSSSVDAVDEFLETNGGGGGTTYKYGSSFRPYTRKQVAIRYQTDHGIAKRTFDVYLNQHGPVTWMTADGHFVTTKLMNIPIQALEQSYLRTKARDYAEYRKTMELFANSSNNTVFADADGDIAYWHGNFIPKRDPRFDYTRPVDGSDPETDWHGLMSLNEIPHLKNPASGYLFNVNDSPWNGAGRSSLKQSDFPAYVEQGIESARGLHAMQVLAPAGTSRTDFTLESLRAAAYDSAMPWFSRTIPCLLAAYDALPGDSPLKAKLSAQIAMLRSWDDRWSADSIPTSLAIFWGTELMKTIAAPARAAKVPSEEWVAARLPATELLSALDAAVTRLTTDFGTWQTPWGNINRFERISDDLVQPFSDAAPSIPVPFASSQWGSMAAFVARPWPGTKKWYGTYGNSFVAVVEFGPRVHAVAITAGGESGHPASPHFNDEATRYATGNLREVYFYPEQLKGHTERVYQPGR